LGQDLTGIVRDCVPFWTEQCLEMSKKLWLPQLKLHKIDYADLDSNYCNSSSTNIKQNSQFSIVSHKTRQPNSLKTLCQSYMSIHVDKWEKEDTLKREKISTGVKIIRLYTTANQSKVFKRWTSTSRYVYNKVLNGIQTNVDIEASDKYNFYKLRDKYVTFKDNSICEEEKCNKQCKNNLHRWEENIPKDIRAGTIKDLITAYKTAYTNLKNKNIQKFKMQYRSKKKNPHPSIPRLAAKYQKLLYI
jgi:hypothetical protein